MGIRDYPVDVVELAKEVLADSKVNIPETDREEVMLSVAVSILESRNGASGEKFSAYVIT